MAFATQRVTSAQSQDASTKQLEERKSVLVAEISTLGVKIEEAEAILKKYGDLSAEAVRVEEELKVLVEEKSGLIKTIADLGEQAETQRRKSDEIAQKEEHLKVLLGRIEEANLELARVEDRVRLVKIDIGERTRELAQVRADLEKVQSDFNQNLSQAESQLKSVRVQVATTNASLESRLKELSNLDKTIGSAKNSLTSFEVQIADKKSELATVSRAVEDIENELVARRARYTEWEDGRREELNQQGLDLAAREGALSDRESMLNGRARKLNEIKVRLEQHMGKRIDLVIE